MCTNQLSKSEIRTADDFWFLHHSVNGYMHQVDHYHIIEVFLEFTKSRTTEIIHKIVALEEELVFPFFGNASSF